MANYGGKNYSGKNYNNRNYGRRRSKYSAIERLAYNMGRVETASSNSRVAESFENGKKATTRTKKPLF